MPYRDDIQAQLASHGEFISDLYSDVASLSEAVSSLEAKLSSPPKKPMDPSTALLWAGSVGFFLTLAGIWGTAACFTYMNSNFGWAALLTTCLLGAGSFSVFLAGLP